MLDISKIRITRNRSFYHYTDQFTLHYKGKEYTPVKASGRIVFKIGIYAVKFDPDDAQSIRNEVELYDRLPKKDKQHFVKIYSYDFRKKIMVVRFMDFLPGAKGRTIAKKGIIKRLVDKYQIEDVCTWSTNNWGICQKTKRPVIYDWEYNYA